jgi:tetratricopeptide (TPR) repeat protein
VKSPDTTETVFTNDRRGAWWMALWLAAVTAAVFWRATECGFINYDDPDYVTDNRHVQQGLAAESIRWAFGTVYEGLWVPATWLSHMLDWQVYGSQPWGHHLTNVLLHVANTVLLFLLVRFLTGSFWRSAFVAALFALHPLHVETVAWISERKGVLSTLFWLLALGAYARYARFKSANAGTQAGGNYAAAMLFFACGLMAKPILVTLPFLLLLLDYWPLERWKAPRGAQETRALRRWGWLVLEKLPFFALAAGFSALTFSASPASLFTPGQRIGNALAAYPRYLWKTLWPEKLALPYPYPPTWDWPVGLVILAGVFLMVVTVWVVRRARRQLYLATGWFWFLGTLAPVLGLVRMGFYSLADRYTYVPLIGLFMMMAWTAGEAVARQPRWKTAAGALAAVLLGLCAWRTDYQLGFWTDSGTLFTHTLAVTERNCIAHANLGIYLMSKGRTDEALQHYREAVRIWPQGARIITRDGGRTPTPAR